MLQGTIIVDNDAVRIDHWRDDRVPASVLAFTFMERRRDADQLAASLGGHGFGGDLLLRSGFEIVCFKPKLTDWYQSVTAADLECVNAYLDGLGHRHALRVGYGSSMGAYATIQFAAILGLDRSLALSPLIDFSGWDHRFSADIAGAPLRWTIRPAALAGRCVHYCVYDPFNLDRRHMAMLAPMLPPDRLVAITLPFSGHPSMFFLKQTDLLAETCLRVLCDGVAPDRARYHRRRRNSAHWHFVLAQTCLGRRKFRAGLCAIDAAIRFDAADAHAHLIRVRLLAGAGQAGAAVAAARRTLDSLVPAAWMIGELRSYARRDRPPAVAAGRLPALRPSPAAFRPVPQPAPP